MEASEGGTHPNIVLFCIHRSLPQTGIFGCPLRLPTNTGIRSHGSVYAEQYNAGDEPPTPVLAQRAEEMAKRLVTDPIV